MSSVAPESPSPASELRPLGVGEMLDRAFTISFKHLLSFTAIVFVVVAPQLLVNYFLAKGPFAVFANQVLSVPNPSTPPDPSKVLGAYAAGAPYLLILLGMALFVAPVANAAVISGVSRAYLGMPVRFVDCYRDALPRWLTLIGLALLWIVTIFAAFTSLALFFGIVGAALAALAVGFGQTGGIVAVVLAIAVGITLILVALELYLAAAFSFVGAVLEKQPAGAAYISGFRRVFGEGQLWRSLGIAAAVIGIAIGFELVALLAGIAIIQITHSLVLQYIVDGVVNSFVYPFLFAVVAVSYYDVRIRREGFDLQMLAAQLQRSSAAAQAAP